MFNRISTFAIIAIALICISCQEDEVTSNTLNGTWIESIDRSDTLIFKTGENFFTLNRGKEIKNGHLLPKYGSGIYQYKLNGNTISVRNTLSSFSGFYDTFLKIENGKLHIGDFYQKDTTNQQTLVFEKMQ